MNRSSSAPFHRTPLFTYIRNCPERRARSADGRPLAVLPAYLIARTGLDRLSFDWLRRPETWTPPAGTGDERLLIRHFVQHTLVRFKVPAFLYKVLEVPETASEQDKNWFIALAAGASVRALPGWPAVFTRPMAHQFRLAPAWMTVTQALFYAQARGYDRSERLAKLLGRQLANLHGYSLTHWTTALDLSLRTGIIDEKNVGQILAKWVSVFERLDAADEAPQSMRLSQLWVEVQQSDSEEADDEADAQRCWPYDRRRGLQRLELPNPMFRPWPASLRRFRVRPVAWSDNLLGEGKRMRHCVGSYLSSCLMGNTFIFQLVPERYEDDLSRRLTLEVDARRQLIQVKGYGNRMPTAFERYLVRVWAKWAGIETEACADF